MQDHESNSRYKYRNRNEELDSVLLKLVHIGMKDMKTVMRSMTIIPTYSTDEMNGTVV